MMWVVYIQAYLLPVHLMSFTKHYLRILHSLIEVICLVIRYVIYRICAWITHFSYNGQLYQQCHGCPMTSPVSPIVSNLYMEQFENLALSTYLYTGLQYWNRYVDDRFVVFHSDENDKFICHIIAVESEYQVYPGKHL